MPQIPPPATDTRHLFRPVASALVVLLRGLPAEAWEAPTVAGEWRVRDVVAHLADLSFRRLSFHRDAMPPPPPARPIDSARAFVDFINGINAEWVAAARRLSPRVLTDLFEKAGTELADWFESLPADAPGLFGVSWAGEMQSEGWFDIGREFTELWHHQAQIRMAVGAEPLADPRYLRAVLEVAVRGLPHAYRDTPAADGAAVAIGITGPAGGSWTLLRRGDGWALGAGEPFAPAATIGMSDDTAWRLLFNALPPSAAADRVRVTGDTALAVPLMQARSIVI